MLSTPAAPITFDQAGSIGRARANASSEVEFHDAWAQRVGAPGRGVATIISYQSVPTQKTLSKLKMSWKE